MILKSGVEEVRHWLTIFFFFDFFFRGKGSFVQQDGTRFESIG